MATQDAWHFRLYLIKTLIFMLAMSILPKNLAQARLLKITKQPQSKVELKKVGLHVTKHYDDFQLKKWIENQKKWNRNTAHQPSPIPPNYCPMNFEKKVSAVKIRGRHLYLDLDELAFLKNAGFVLKEAELEIVLQGRHKAEESVLISLNGLAVKYPNRSKLNEMIDYFKAHDYSRTHFKLHNFIISAEPFYHYLGRIRKQKGLLKISLYGGNYKILSASITFKGTAYNPCGNPDPDPIPDPSPEEDLSKYAVTINSVNPAGSQVSSANMLINFSSPNTDGTYWCSLDSVDFEKCDSPVSYAALTNGNHNFQVFATTPKGVDGAKASYSWTVNTIRPVVTITNADQLPTLTNDSNLSFEFTSTKAGSTFRCRLDNDTLYSCSSPMSYNVVSDGLHKFSVIAVDSLGNISSAPAEFQWTLDQSPPTAQYIEITPNSNVSSETYRNFSFGADETSNFECALDSSEYTVCNSPLNLTSISEGAHNLSLRATDLAGNVGPAVSYSWLSDYRNPVISLGSISPALGITNSKNISSEFFMNEPGTAFCSFDSAVPSPCISPFVRDNLSEGQHSLSIYALDRAGLKSETVNLSWVIDLSAPIISFGQILPTAASIINSSQMKISINSSEDLSLSASLNGLPMTFVDSTLFLQNLTEGSYTLEVFGTDNAGNKSNVITHLFQIDLTAPVVDIFSPGNSLSNEDFRTFQFTANEPTQFECSLDEAGFTPCQDSMTYSGLADGEHNFVLKATDLAGNISLNSFSWSQDITAPITSQSNFLNGNTITFYLSATESNVNYLCSLDGVPISPCNSTITYSNLEVGEHIFLARAIDLAGNIDPLGAHFSFTVEPPISTIITNGNPPGELVNSKQMVIAFTSDQPASGFVCSLDGAVPTSCVSAVTYSNLSEGVHTVLIRAIDQFGKMDPVGATKTWTVDTIAPVVSNFITSTTNNSITVNWTTNEPATSRVNYGVGSTLNQNTAEITLLETNHSIKLVGLLNNTTYSIRVIGKDAAGNTYISNIITSRTNP